MPDLCEVAEEAAAMASDAKHLQDATSTSAAYWAYHSARAAVVLPGTVWSSRDSLVSDAPPALLPGQIKIADGTIDGDAVMQVVWVLICLGFAVATDFRTRISGIAARHT